MGKGRMDDVPFGPVVGTAVCVDCEERFTVKVYFGEDTGQAFVRDHPQNGCHVKDRQTVNTTIEKE